MSIPADSADNAAAPAAPRGGRRCTSQHKGPTATLLSVVTVVFNGADRLPRTMDSVFACAALPLEYIVVDGGSTDRTLDLIRAAENQIDLWLSEPDRGIFDAMNKALHLCSGEYVHFLNCGDWLEPFAVIERALELLRARPTLLMGRVKAIAGDGSVRLLPRQHGLLSAREKFASAYCHQAAFASTAAMRAAGGFDKRFRHFADFYALMRITQPPATTIESDLVVANFPLDGVSSDWRRAPALYDEKEELLAALGERADGFSRRMGKLRAHLYRLKMALRDRVARQP